MAHPIAEAFTVCVAVAFGMFLGLLTAGAIFFEGWDIAKAGLFDLLMLLLIFTTGLIMGWPSEEAEA